MKGNLNSSPCLVLNADYQPLSYFPLSLWGWQETIKAVFLNRVNIVAEYDISVKSTSFSMKLPSVISLKKFIPIKKNIPFTRFNLFLRDHFKRKWSYIHDNQNDQHIFLLSDPILGKFNKLQLEFYKKQNL